MELISKLFLITMILKLTIEMIQIFANSKSNEQISEFNKSVFTMCEYREGEKCPP